jgi:Ca2+-binding EF-hand superfamily protein
MEDIIKAIYDIIGEKKRTGKNSPHTKVKDIMNQLDTNNDGVISIEEFLNGCETNPSLNSLLAPTTYQVHL